MIGHAIFLHSLCKVNEKAAGMAWMINLYEVCGSRINNCVVHDLTLTTWLTAVDDADGEEGGVGFEEVSSVSEVGVVKVGGIDEGEMWEVTVCGVEGVSVGGVAPVDVVGVVASEVLLSEKQVNAHHLIHQQMSKWKPQLTNDKLKRLQWLECWITTLAQCITTLCRQTSCV